MRCATCENEALPGQQFCAQHRGAPRAQAATGEIYANFWQRAGGLVIDYFIVAVGLTILAAILIPLVSDLVGYLLLLALVAYYVGFESSALQGTPGKIAMSIKVTDLSGERVGVGRALGRYVGKIISWMILGIGFLMAAFTGRRQALHDMMAGTLITRRSLAPEQIAGAGPAAPASAAAVVGVIAVCVFGGILLAGVIAGISVPAYQDYTIRAQVSEGMSLAGIPKAAVEIAYANGRPLDELTTDILGLQEDLTGSYVDSIGVMNGAIVITYGREANARIADRVLLVHPVVSQTNELEWVCGRAAIPPDSTPALANAAAYTTVENRYLPASCRAR